MIFPRFFEVQKRVNFSDTKGLSDIVSICNMKCVSTPSERTITLVSTVYYAPTVSEYVSTGSPYKFWGQS